MPNRTDELLALAERYVIPHKPMAMGRPVLARARGSECWDVEGKRYIDFLSGQVCSTIGHSHPRIVEALQEACEKMVHCNANMQNEDSILLAERLATLMPGPISRSLFKSSGSEANEAAIHLAKRFTGNWEVVSLAGAFHGLTAGPRSSTFTRERKGYGPGLPGTFSFPVPDCYRSPHATRMAGANGYVCETLVAECLAYGEAMLDAQSEGYPAAIVIEPIMSAGGVNEPPVSYFQGLKRLANDRGMLVIMDECQTGLARAGAMFASDGYGFVPDVITLSKTLGGGLPVSSVSTSPDIVDAVTKTGFVHSASHINDPFAARVGLAVIDVIVGEGLCAVAARKGEEIKARLRMLAQRFELIGDVRGRGMMIGVEMVRDRETKAHAGAECRRFYELCLEEGLIVNVCGTHGNVVRMMPPVTISDSEIDEALAMIERALLRLEAETSSTPDTARRGAVLQ